MLHANALRHPALMALLLLGGIMAVMPAPAAASRCIPAGSTGSAVLPAAETLDEAATLVLREVNRERVARELVRLDPDPRLALAAQRHARDMVRRGFFSHVTPEGGGMTTRVRAAGYLRTPAGWALGEVLAWGAGSCSTPAAVVAAWMASPSHRRVLLGRRYRELGVGVALGTPFAPAPVGGATYAAELGFVRP